MYNTIVLNVGDVKLKSLDECSILLPYTGNLGATLLTIVEIAGCIAYQKMPKRYVEAIDSCIDLGFVDNLQTAIGINIPIKERAGDIFYDASTYLKFIARSPALDITVSSKVLISLTNSEIIQILDEFYNAGGLGLSKKILSYRKADYMVWRDIAVANAEAAAKF